MNLGYLEAIWRLFGGFNHQPAQEKMVARLIPSPLTPKRVRGSAGSLSEAKKGVAKVCGDRSPSVGDYSRQRTSKVRFPWATRVAHGPPRVKQLNFYGVPTSHSISFIQRDLNTLTLDLPDYFFADARLSPYFFLTWR